MNRRELLEWMSRGLAATVTAVIALPGIQYLVGGMQSSVAQQSEFLRLKRLQDLPIGRPVIVPILGCKQDAWTRCDQQVVGRVWMIRDGEKSSASGPAQSEVQVLSSVCPHMGCQIQANSSEKGFVCPCHGASFGLHGERLTAVKAAQPNHAPRDMDCLSCRVVKDTQTGDDWVEVKYETFVTGLPNRVVRS